MIEAVTRKGAHENDSLINAGYKDHISSSTCFIDKYGNILNWRNGEINPANAPGAFNARFFLPYYTPGGENQKRHTLAKRIKNRRDDL